MKLLKFYILLVIGLLSSLTSCSKGDDGGSEPEKISVTANPQSLSFETAGGSKSVTITSSREWSAYTDDEWISLTNASATSGTSTMTVTAKENTTYGDASRTGTVTVKCGSERVSISVSQESPAKPAITCSIDGYDNLVFDDEFEQTGASLNADKWTHEVQKSGWVNNELQNYVNEKSPNGTRVTEVSDGILKIRCFKEDGKVYSGRIYGNVNTGFKYGVFEARIKLPKGKGTWPAWWMMPANNNYSTNPWPGCGEIDIMEEVGVDANYVSSTIHCTKYNNGNTATEHASKKVDTAESDFHLYVCEWTSEYIKFYVDGSCILTYNPSSKTSEYWPFNVPFYPILNLAWGGDWGGYKGVDESALPATMEVDYVRIFQK